MEEAMCAHTNSNSHSCVCRLSANYLSSQPQLTFETDTINVTVLPVRKLRPREVEELDPWHHVGLGGGWFPTYNTGWNLHCHPTYRSLEMGKRWGGGPGRGLL
jgi:hypothetical protein